MHQISLNEVKRRALKSRDAWWTVFLVDPLAVRIVHFLYPYKWATPNRVTLTAFAFGLGAAYAFWNGALILGGVLFYLGFVFDCVDGKVARLKGTGSAVGAWMEFLLDRVRLMLGVGTLYVGQFRATGDETLLWLGAAVVVLDLLHYLSGAEIHQLRLRTAGDSEAAKVSMREVGPATGPMRLFRRVATWLESHRVRPRLFTAIELEQFACVVAPITGALVLVTSSAVVLHVVFEALIIVLFVRAAKASTATSAP